MMSKEWTAIQIDIMFSSDNKMSSLDTRDINEICKHWLSVLLDLLEQRLISLILL